MDPLADAPLNIGTSPYAYVWNNPLVFIDPEGRHGESTHVDELGNVLAEFDDGDDGVYVHANGTTADDISCTYSCENTSAGGLNIGSLGGNIDMGVTGMYSFKVANSANQVLAEDFTFGKWVTNVKGGGDWDLKANKETIWGVAWAYDAKNKTSTSFSTPNLTFEDASDFGNYHAGFTGSMFGIYVPVQKIGAGVIEQLKDLRKGNINQVGNQFGQMFKFWERNAFMDETDDHYWNTQGMSDAKYLKERLNLSSTNLLNVRRQ